MWMFYTFEQVILADSKLSPPSKKGEARTRSSSHPSRLDAGVAA